MTNEERAEIRHNEEKERISKEPFEMRIQEDVWKEWYTDIPNEEIIAKICKLLIENNLSYLEANKALYYADKALKQKTLSSVILAKNL